MAILPIVLEPTPILRQKAAPVQRVTKRVQKLLKDMAETMYDAPGVGLAAPQVGVSQRIIVADAGDGLISIINPQIVASSGTDVDLEGCLSIPGIQGYVERATEVEVRGLDERGRPLRIRTDGLLARILQHEIDHLEGILITDVATGLRRIDEDEGEEVAEADDSATEELPS